jgi:hypothetical protein
MKLSVSKPFYSRLIPLSRSDEMFVGRSLPGMNPGRVATEHTRQNRFDRYAITATTTAIRYKHLVATRPAIAYISNIRFS